MNIEISYTIQLSDLDVKTLEHFWNEPIGDVVPSLMPNAGYRWIREYIDACRERLESEKNARD